MIFKLDKYFISLIIFLLLGLSNINSQNRDSIDFYKDCDDKYVHHATFLYSTFPGGDDKLADLIRGLNLDKKYKGQISIFYRVNCNGEATDFRLLGRGRASDVERKVYDLISNQKQWIPPQIDNKPVNANSIITFWIKRGRVVKISRNQITMIDWDSDVFLDTID